MKSVIFGVNYENNNILNFDVFFSFTFTSDQFRIESRTVLNESGDLRVAGEYLASVVVDKYALPSFLVFSSLNPTQPIVSTPIRYDIFIEIP